MPVNTAITFRKGSSSQWNSTNPVLASGEPGYDITNNILKIGDGVSAWNSLSNHKHSSIDISDFNSSVSGLVSGIYQPLLTNPVTGVGTSGYLSRWNGTNSVTSGIIFDNGSNIGIDIITPAEKLEINGSLKFANCSTRILRGDNNNLRFSSPSSALGHYGIYIDNTGTTNGRIFRLASWADGTTGKFIIRDDTGGQDRFVIQANGDIGVGTNSPAYKLDIVGNTRTSGNHYVTNNLGVGTTAPSGQLHVIGTGIISSRVGIGTNSPTFDLDVRTNSDNAFYVAQGSGARFLSFGSTGFINNTTLSVSKSTWNSLATIELSTTAASRRGLVVEQVASQTANAIETRSNTATVLSYINSGGGAYFASNVGIGTSTPTRQLHVIGTGLIASTTGLPANALLDVYSTTSGEMVFNVEGTNGSLFSVIDNLSGSLMSVNNNAGLPIFEVFSDDSIIAGRFNQNDFVVSSGGNIGIGKALPSVKLDVVGTVAVSGAFSATTKSFKIDHPSKPDHTLEYGSLESPYHGVRLTGRDKVSKGICIVKLPSYLKDLIHNDDSINIQLTNLYHDKILYISKIDLSNNNFIVCAKRAKSLPDLEFCWTFTGIRKDVDLVVENIK